MMRPDDGPGSKWYYLRVDMDRTYGQTGAQGVVDFGDGCCCCRCSLFGHIWCVHFFGVFLCCSSMDCATLLSHVLADDSLHKEQSARAHLGGQQVIEVQGHL